MSLPIACSLTDSELQERRRGVLSKVGKCIVEVRELENGYAYCFPPDGALLSDLAELIVLERQCCPFLWFRMTVESNNGPVWLEMTGPKETKEFLATTFTWN